MCALANDIVSYFTCLDWNFSTEEEEASVRWVYFCPDVGVAERKKALPAYRQFTGGLTELIKLKSTAA
ncbi:hypothetical protein EYF80_023221 [Liparis tanakae]|uniref:Uncharacterized protein n=1 Tax=Liparis tanakae TaxID=230148 RepID=A0A4Z2HMM3_9TELE|nr:hypothetical protein EYF80_023221 [Liparis tanakae]